MSGMGIGVLIGTKLGIVRTTDYRMAAEGRWSRQLVLDVATTFEQHIVPTADADTVVIDAPVDAPVGAPLRLLKQLQLLVDLVWKMQTSLDLATLVAALVVCTCRLARRDLVITMKLVERELKSVLGRRRKDEPTKIARYNDVKISLLVNLKDKMN